MNNIDDLDQEYINVEQIFGRIKALIIISTTVHSNKIRGVILGCNKFDKYCEEAVVMINDVIKAEGGKKKDLVTKQQLLTSPAHARSIVVDNQKYKIWTSKLKQHTDQIILVNQ